MSKVGYVKSSVRTEKAVVESVMEDTRKHRKVGDQGGREYKIDDPTSKLLHTIGAGFFNEPTYYEDESKTNKKGIREGGKELMKTMCDVAESSPEDFMVILAWARDELHLRTTPEVGMAVAARIPGCRELLPLYESKILTRADQIKNVFAAYRHLYCQKDKKDSGHVLRGTLPKKLSVALGQAFSRFSEYDFMKYDGGIAPYFKDVLLMIKQKTNGKPAVSKEYFEYLVNEKIIDGRKTPIFYARDKFNKSKSFEDSLESALKGQVTWETFMSKWGSSEDQMINKRNWEWLLDNKRMGYMAVLRNLRNFQDASISQKHWDLVYGILTEKDDHKQYPFRFLAARQAIGEGNKNAVSAIDMALDNSTKNVERLPGETLIMMDLSDSMRTAKVSKDSDMSNKMAGAALCAIAAKSQGRKTSVWGFGASQKEINFSEADSTMSIINKILNTDVGHSTIPGPIVSWAYTNNREFARIVVISDMCCYTGGGSDSLPVAFGKYISKFPDTYLYSINLSPDSQGSQMDSRNPKVCLLSGFSEKVFNIFADFEGVGTATDVEDEQRPIPTMEQLRKKYLVEKK